MPHFKSRPDEAEQYTGPDSLRAVAELVLRYRPQASYETNAVHGTLRFYNGGRDVKLKLNDWVAVIGGDLAVIPPALFEGSLVPETDEPSAES